MKRSSLRMAMTIIGALVLMLWVGGAAAQEHPEHPKEHPSEHPTAEKKVTVETLAAAIENYINDDAELKGGWFMVWDQEKKEPLALKLVKVHKERLADIGGGVYFACTDLKSPADKIYDLDFFMKDTENGLKVTEISIHKESGAPRYNWKEENGIWLRVDI